MFHLDRLIFWPLVLYTCTIISMLHAFRNWMLLSPDSLVSFLPCLWAVWIDLLHVNFIWKDSGMEQRKAQTLSFTCQLVKHIRDSWSLNRIIQSTTILRGLWLSATIHDSGCGHIPNSPEVLTFPILSYPGIHHLRRTMDHFGQIKAKVQRKLPLDAEFLPRSDSYLTLIWLHLEWVSLKIRHAGIPPKKDYFKGEIDDRQ